MTPPASPRRAGFARALRTACRLALRDWLHESHLTLCSVISLVSALVPLLLLLGIRNGIVGTLEERLLENPALLGVTPSGSGPGYTRAWLEALAGRPDVAFVIPKTRDISATVQMEAGGAGDSSENARFSPVDTEPTGPGDPLLERFHAVPDGRDKVTLSALAAERLGVRPGDKVRVRLGRATPSGGLEARTLELGVAAVLPPEAEARALGFILLPLLEDMENYRDGFAVPAFDAPGGTPPAERRFARFRLYARDMDSVAQLREHFLNLGVEVQTSARDIQTFQQIRAALTALFILIAATVGAGFAASTASAMLAAVRRKDRDLGMLRLLGFPGSAILIFPLVQTQATAFCGALLAGALALCTGTGLDLLFASVFDGAAVTRLPLSHFLLTGAGVSILSLLASLPAAARALRVEPSEVLRMV